MKIKISTIINILIILLMGHIFAPAIMGFINTNHIPGFPINIFAKNYILLLLHGFLLVYRPQVFLSKPMGFVYLYSFIFFLFRISGYYNIENIWFGAYQFPVYLSIMIYTYYISAKDYKNLGIVIISSLILIVISALINIIQLIRFPEATRVVMGTLAVTGYEKLQSNYSSIGIAGYGFVTGVSCLFPVLIGFFKNEKMYYNRLKYFFLIAIILVAYSVYISSITTNIIISIIGIFLAVSGRKKLKMSLIIVIIFLMVFTIMPTFLSNIFHILSEISSNQVVSQRMNEIGYGLEYGFNVYNPLTSVDYRASRIPLNINHFLRTPFFGKGEEVNAHIFWLNYLAQFGLIGTLPLVFIFVNQIKSNLKNFHKNFKYYYLLSMFLFIFIGFIKSYSPSQMMYIVFIIVPGVYYLRYLKSQLKLSQ